MKLLSAVLTYKRRNLIEFNIISILQLKSLRLKEVEHLPNRGTFSNVRSSRGCFQTLGYLKADEVSVPPSACVPVTPQLHVLCSCKK